MAHATAPIEPTISSVTTDSSTITVNMVTTGIDASSWRWTLTRRQVSGCANTYGDGVVQSTNSLVPTFQIAGTTEGCTYVIRVAGFNGVIGDYADFEKVAGGFQNGLRIFVRQESGPSSGMTITPFTTGICSAAYVVVPNIAVNYGSSGPAGCTADGFTAYYVGYVRAPITGTVTFKSRSDDGFVLRIQGQTVIQDLTDHGPSTTFDAQGSVSMRANEVYRIEAWHHENTTGAAAYLDWEYSGVSQTSVPSNMLGTDPSVLTDGCPIGLAARCPASSAMEIERVTGTNMDGQYWIVINGTPTLVYCVMNNTQGGGGWMLAMRGDTNTTTFNYDSAFWTNTTLLNNSNPHRLNIRDPLNVRTNTDAKYEPFAHLPATQVMVLYPEITNIAGGAFGTNGSANTIGINNDRYGFAWHETFTAGTPWTAYDSGTKWGGSSWNVAHTGGPSATPTCVNSASTLTNLFLTASRCAFRRVSSNYVSTEVPYSAVGNNLFFSQTNIRFFGINYGNANTSFYSKARIGFGWNENGVGDESSNDGNGGIGLSSSGSTSLGAGTYNGCCSGTVSQADANTAGQTGISGGDATTRHLGFELYMRNFASTAINGSNLRVVSKRTGTMTAGGGFTAPSTNGSNTYRLSPLREGIFIDSSTGVVTVSEGLPIGTYTSTVSVSDSNGVSGTRSFTVEVVADSFETDTALSFNGTSSLSTSGTFVLTGDQTWEAWVKPTNACSSTQKTIIGSDSFVLLCISGYWHASFKNSAGAWASFQSSQRIVYDAWTHLAVVRSGTSASMFVNNSRVAMLVSSVWSDAWTVSTVNATPSVFYFGGYGAGQYYSGEIDEVKIWEEARTLTQIVTDMHAQPNLASRNLLAYWDFNDGAGNPAISRAQRSDSTYNLSPTSGQYVSVASTTTSGPYTVVTIPRTLISTSGGWRAPDSVTALFAMVVGGGGGGGGGYQGGGGGGGGVLHQRVSVTPKSIYPIRVGVGGRGAYNPARALNGETSTAFGISAAGGGSGASEMNSSGANVQFPANSGGSGGGGVWGTFMSGASGIAGQGSNGGSSTSLESPTCSPNAYAGAGGGGAGTGGSAPSCTKGGNGGNGRTSQLNSTVYGGGGGGSLRGATTLSGRGLSTSGGGGSSAYVSGAMPGATDGAESGLPGTGGGGGAGLSTDGLTGFGGDGGSGTVIFRFLTAQKPTFTYPRNTTINVGMVESFSVNIAADSATTMLTRTFRWESSTTGVNGTFSLVKQGTGAENAFFAWSPPDTSTTGNQFVYRVIVTDSDTAGLFYTDTSTPVFATINSRLLLSGKSAVSKTVNINKTETFTVTGGTSTYRYTLTPDGPNFWLDTTTALSPRLRMLDTVTVGTYFETITVIDSISATSFIPLTIKVSPPPSFSANAEQVDSGTVLYLDAGNTTSYSGSGSSWTDISGRNLPTSIAPTGLPAQFNNGPSSCASPTYSGDVLGSFNFTRSNKTCAFVTNFGFHPIYTAQVWVKRDGTQNDYATIISTPWPGWGNQIAISLHWINSTKIQAGVYKNGGWGTFTSEVEVPNLTWTFVTITFDGSTISLMVNGSVASKNAGTPDATVALTSSLNNTGLFIGKRFDGDVDYINGSVASIRIYNRVLSDAEILQNYNATKGRFDNTQNKQNQSGKYGISLQSPFVDTFTITSGSETITSAWSNSSLTRITWDTSTARSLVVSITGRQTPGIYYDTITVTDIYGSSTRLPLTYTIAKADTLTVRFDAGWTLSYTGRPAIFGGSLYVFPLGRSEVVSNDPTLASVRYRPGGTTCATGGTCAIGDIGPGGGIVFITPSTTGGNGRFFEAAPFTWAGTDELGTASTYCSNHNLNVGATNFGIGWGETNTNLAKAACLGGAVARVDSFNSSNNTGYSDWFIPSSNELAELAKVRAAAGLLALRANWNVGRFGYWSSTETSATAQASLVTSSWNMGGTNKSDALNNLVRPVRMFTPCWALNRCAALASSSKPTNAGLYEIYLETVTFSSGSASNYVAIVFETSTVTINRISQSNQQGVIYTAAYPETFTLFEPSGSSTGAVSYNVTSGGTATDCSTDYKKIVVGSPGTCNIQVVRWGDRNYLSDTTTVYIYFMNFVNNQPTVAVGSGPNIALSGINSVQLEATTAPTISGLSSSSGAVGSTITISGAGFYFADPNNLSIKFWRNISASTYTINSDSSVTVTVPIGATTGRIVITTPNGQAASSTFTVTP